MKCLMLVLVLSMVGGCAYRGAFVLESGEKVDALYYHESRMPGELMVEMWVDFDSRRLRFKCGLHDALGWDSRLFDGARLELAMNGREWRNLMRHICRAQVEAWPDIRENPAASPLDATSYYLRLRTGEKTIEKFSVGAPPRGAGEIQSVVQFALAHKSLRLCPGDVPEVAHLPPAVAGRRGF